MDYGLTARDRMLQSAFYELAEIIKDEDQRNKIGLIITKYFILKQDVNDRVGKVIQLMKMWQCESDKFSLEEQQRLISLMNEQFIGFV